MVDVNGGRRYVATGDDHASRSYMLFVDAEQPRDLGHADARDLAYRHGVDLPEFGHPTRFGQMVLRRVS